MPPRKFVAQGSKIPAIDYGHNVPIKVVVSFFFLGTAVIILTISLVGLIVSVKARFEILTAAINSLTMKDEFQREYESFILSRRFIEREHSNKLKVLENKKLNALDRLETFDKYNKILKKFEEDLQRASKSVTEKYAAYKANNHADFRFACARQKIKALQITDEVVDLTRKVVILDDALKETSKKLSEIKTYIKDLFPRNYQYYQLGGYPSPEKIYPFLDWSIEFAADRLYIQLSNDIHKFGQRPPVSQMTDLESAFALDFIPAVSEANVSYYLKKYDNGTHNLKLDLASIPGLSPKSRSITIWKLRNDIN